MNRKLAQRLTVMAGVFIGIILGILLSITFNTPQTINKNICLGVTPSYHLSCAVNGQNLTAISSEYNFKKMQKYNCTIKDRFDQYSIGNCSIETNATKYKFAFLPRN